VRVKASKKARYELEKSLREGYVLGKKRLRGLQSGDEGAYVVNTGVLIKYLNGSSSLARKVKVPFEDAIRRGGSASYGIICHS